MISYFHPIPADMYISLGFCCYQYVYHIFNMSCLGVILQVRGRDDTSTPQNGVAAYWQSHVFCHGGLPWFSPRFSSSWVSFSYGRSSLTAEAFLWAHCLQSAATFWCRLLRSGLQDATALHVLRCSTLVGLWFNTAAPFSFGLPVYPLSASFIVRLPLPTPHNMGAPALTSSWRQRGFWGQTRTYHLLKIS